MSLTANSLKSIFLTKRPFSSSSSTQIAKNLPISQHPNGGVKPKYWPWLNGAEDTYESSLKISMENFGHVCDVPSLWLQRHCYVRRESLESIKHWENIDRGSKLFIRGLGKFDIGKVHRRYVKKRYIHFWMGNLVECFYKHKLEALCSVHSLPKTGTKEKLALRLLSCHDFDPVKVFMESSNDDFRDSAKVAQEEFEKPFVIPTPVQIQVEAYFEDAHLGCHDGVNQHVTEILSQDQDAPPRIHLIKYYKAWLENLGSLDEVSDRRYAWPEQWENLKPNQLLNYLREEAIKKNIPLKIFPHLDELPDKGHLRVLRTSHEIVKAGKELKNCAAMYIDKVRNKKCILVTYHSHGECKAHALGMLEFDVSKPMIASTWCQIYKSCNRPAPPEIKDAYNKYTKTVHSWFRQYHRDNE